RLPRRSLSSGRGGRGKSGEGRIGRCDHVSRHYLFLRRPLTARKSEIDVARTPGPAPPQEEKKNLGDTPTPPVWGCRPLPPRWRQLACCPADAGLSGGHPFEVVASRVFVLEG